MNNILVVDDEADICLLLTGHLKKMGFNATYCLTIREAIGRVESDTYDLIFVDLNLTDGSGYDLINNLKKNENPAKIVVISAYDSERQRAIRSGANMFVPKPFTKVSIQSVLKELNLLEN